MTLENICWENKMYFRTILLGNNYCQLSFNRKINCIFLGEKDKNGLYTCTAPEEKDYQ